MRTTRSAARAVLLAAAFFAVPPVLAAPPCTDWNSASFFAVARAEDVRRCLDAGARLDARNELGATPLHFAAANSDALDVEIDQLREVITVTPAVVRTLLDAGAAVDARDEDGETPLHS